MSPDRVGASARAALTQPGSTRRLSAASLWEAAIKIGRGKLRLGQPLSHYHAVSLASMAVEPLSVTAAHAMAVHDLPAHHRDPFDRMLVAQARAEGLTLATADPALYAYDVDLLWAAAGRPPGRPDGTGRVAERRRGRLEVAGRAGGTGARGHRKR